jgi:ATPase subunit of ABC transporter with duplicated ATPase domains
VGKSTLLAVLAGEIEPQKGQVRLRSRPCRVPQALGAAPVSEGERRRLALLAAQRSGAEILLLDEPTEGLDDEAIAWLRGWLSQWPGCVVVASHDRRLLADFASFFVASESGCRAFEGTLDALEAELERDHREVEQRYAASLRRLAEQEAHTLHVARRKARKKRYGRCSELDRRTPRVRLNQKRDHAQVSHGRLAAIREQRLDEARTWSKATRRALAVTLPLPLRVPTLPEDRGADVLVLEGVSARAGERSLFAAIDLRLRRERVAVVGANGAGKTTLLEIALGRRRPSSGSAWCDAGRIGSIAQGGADWRTEASLVALLAGADPSLSPADAAEILAAHRFPLALAERPLRSLSPGERARAALICLFRRSPAPEVLILDEPTYCLDLVGQRALRDALRAWPGGLLVAAHDRDFLAAIGVDRTSSWGERRLPVVETRVALLTSSSCAGHPRRERRTTMSQRNEALLEVHGVSPEHTHEQAVAVGNALLIALGSAGSLTPKEMETFLSIATSYGASPDAIEGWKRFDYAGGKIADHVQLEPRLARHLMWEAIRICRAGSPPGADAKLSKVARALAVDIAVLAPLQGFATAEDALEKGRAALIEGTAGMKKGTPQGATAGLAAIAEKAAYLRKMRIATMETGKPS